MRSPAASPPAAAGPWAAPGARRGRGSRGAQRARRPARPSTCATPTCHALQCVLCPPWAEACERCLQVMRTHKVCSLLRSTAPTGWICVWDTSSQYEDHSGHARKRGLSARADSREVAADGAQPGVLSRPRLQHKVQAASGRAVRLAQPICEAPAHALPTSRRCNDKLLQPEDQPHTCLQAHLNMTC